jgi:hypothetical protein
MDHPLTLRSVNILGITPEIQGKYGEAEQVHRKLVKQRESILGSCHQDTIVSPVNLSVRKLGSLTDAEILLQGAVERSKTIFLSENRHAMMTHWMPIMSLLGVLVSSPTIGKQDNGNRKSFRPE